MVPAPMGRHLSQEMHKQAVRTALSFRCLAGPRASGQAAGAEFGRPCSWSGLFQGDQPALLRAHRVSKLQTRVRNR